MALEIYKRRHSPKCLTEIAQFVQKGKLKQPTEKELQQYARCDCAWWVRGTTDHGKTILPKTLKVYSKAAAQEEANKLNRPDTPKPEFTPTTLVTAREKWMKAIAVRDVSEESTKNYRVAIDHLEKYMKKRGYVHLHQMTLDDINELRFAWKAAGLRKNTQRTYFTSLKRFFKSCFNMELIPKNPMDKVEPMAKRRRRTPGRDDEDDENATLPLDEDGDSNYRKILAGVKPFFEGRLRYIKKQEGNPLNYQPETFIALLELMYETGLRISDAIHFRIDSLHIEEGIGVYTTDQIKTGRPVTVYPPLWLAQKLKALPRISGSRFIFFDGRKNWSSFVGSAVRKPLATLGDLVGIPGVRPHRFRDSFAVNRLNEKIAMDDLRLLLGHENVAMTERYYAPFVKSRKNTLRDTVRDARREAAPDNVVPIRQVV